MDSRLLSKSYWDYFSIKGDQGELLQGGFVTGM